MKPFSIVLTINLSFFAIWGLFFTLVMNRPEMIPLMTSVQAAFNALFACGFYVDRKPQIFKAFAWGILLTAIVSAAGYLVLIKYRHLIGFEESYTAFLQAYLPSALRA
jgi:hypothetical protein